MNHFSNPHSVGCPWHSFTEKVGAPNIKWCEETICSIVSEPINTWTNLSYLLVGVIVFIMAKNTGSSDKKWFGPIVFIMGACSFFYHMSNNYISQLFDFIGMYFMLFWIFMINSRRAGWISKSQKYILYWSLCIVFTALVHFMYTRALPFQNLVVLAALMIFTSEVYCYRKGNRPETYKFLMLATIFIIIGEVFSLMDLYRVICLSDYPLLQGHGIWHLFGGLSMFYAYKHLHALELE